MNRNRTCFLIALLILCVSLAPLSFASASSVFTSSCPPAFRLLQAASGELSGEAAEGVEESLSGTLEADSLFYTRGEWSCVSFSGELRAPGPVE